uniref:Innexin n=1 Tax=Ditylenchus dipsaci TaxID=166011 RepID=A0A915EHF2_9BILA
MASDFDMVAPLAFVDNMLKVVKAPRGRTSSTCSIVGSPAWPYLCPQSPVLPGIIWAILSTAGAMLNGERDGCSMHTTTGVPYNRTELVQQQEISYYQWMPFILILQGLLFMAPLIIWRALDGTVSGIPVQTVLSMAREATTSASSMDSKDRRNIAHHMKVCLDDKYGDGVKFPVKIYRFISQRSLTFLYCFTKILFIGNSLLQFYLLGRFLGKAVISGASPP